jgi:hypothetical protein
MVVSPMINSGNPWPIHSRHFICMDRTGAFACLPRSNLEVKDYITDSRPGQMPRCRWFR